MIKSFTDLSQSKKLVGILPLESADYCWGIDVETSHYNSSPYPCAWKDYSCKEYYIPCWSLAALLEQLKSEIILENKQLLFLHINKYNDIDYDIRYTNSWTGEVLITEEGNLVDACVEMILKLHELKML